MGLVISVLKNLFSFKKNEMKSIGTQTYEHSLCYESESDFDSDVDSLSDAKPIFGFENDNNSSSDKKID